MYKATITTANEMKVYVGMTESLFKSRFNNHNMSFKHRKYWHSTIFSAYVWDLKDKNIDHTIKWSVIKKACQITESFSKMKLTSSAKYPVRIVLGTKRKAIFLVILVQSLFLHVYTVPYNCKQFIPRDGTSILRFLGHLFVCLLESFPVSLSQYVL